MNNPQLIAIGQRLLSLGLAAALTLSVLLSLGAQADGRHADALAQSANGGQLCAARPGPARS